MHTVVEGQETATNRLPGAGLDTLSMLHAAPFHRSASTEPPATPTAVHTTVDGHDTPESEPNSGPTGSLVGWCVQPEPFARHTAVTEFPAASSNEPTAVDAVGLAHATPLSGIPAPAASGSVFGGAGAIAHLMPFHLSTSSRNRPC
jgi:hypothetical protein